MTEVNLGNQLAGELGVIRGYRLLKVLRQDSSHTLFLARGGRRNERVLLLLQEGLDSELKAIYESCKPWLKIRHPGIIPLKELCVEQNALIAVFPYLLGISLDQLNSLQGANAQSELQGEMLAKGIQSQLDASEQSANDPAFWKKGFEPIAADLFSQLAKTLDAVHQLGVGFGQIKAQQIWVTPYGRALWFAPCQMSTTQIDAVQNRFQLGQIFRETLHFFAPKISDPLDRIQYAAAAEHEADRYTSGTQFAADLERFLSGEPVLVHRPGFVKRVTRQIAANPRKAAAVFLALALFAAGVVWLVSSSWISPKNLPVLPPKQETVLPAEKSPDQKAELDRKPFRPESGYRSSVPGFISGKGSNLSPR